MTLVGCAYTEEGDLDWPLTEAFLRSYHEVRPLTAVDCELAAAFLQFALLSIAFWRFRQFNVRVKDEERKNSHLPMQRRMEALIHGSDADTLTRLIQRIAA
jgi:Ser/Thr protein kinase RdoA (MazF antagonist)